MDNKLFDFQINIDWNLINTISETDRFDSEWAVIERREVQSLKQLKTIASIRSAGASNRIEGNRMTDGEIDVLLKNMDITKLTDRDSQEVIGYFDTLDLIAENSENIAVTENNIRSLHNTLMKYSSRDEWHKGSYKTHNNAVEATFGDGTRQIIFRTTEAGFATEDAVRRLVVWYNAETEVHNLVKIAAFVYEFLSIHPFQDGNGRLSRLLSTLLLLKNGYKWIQYISFEHEIESRKSEYYRALRACQAQRPNEDISVWVRFFLGSLRNIQLQLMLKLEQSGAETKLSPREKTVLTLIQNYPGIKSGEISERLAIPKPTVKRILSGMVAKSLLEQHGNGKNTSYSAK
ncbi:MAG: Fic family protein [Dysgonamonadaceae bacterium]|jgi:Fic family protein|nr:Fic family protein [Dysgonamonadaceae bacterium]